MSADTLAPWQCRTASPEAGRLDAMAAALRAHYPGASVRVAVSSPVVEVSVSRDGRGWLSTRIHGATLAEAIGEMERVVAGLVSP